MFLVKSAFWLAIAFLVIKPGFDFSATANAMSAEAVRTGQHVIAEQLQNIDCTSLECVGGKAVLAAVLTTDPAAASSTEETTQLAPVPFPRPRPDHAG